MHTRKSGCRGRANYKKDVEEWEIGMHEFLSERDVSDESLQEFMEALGGDFADRLGVVKALGVYWGRKRLQPEFDKKITYL